ncbi:MAG: hypothetical protein WB611_16580 [Stellaceae bacterium]
MPETCPTATIRSNVRDQLDSLEREVTELRQILAEIISRAGQVFPWDTPGFAMKLNPFLAATGMPRRTFYYFREKKKVRTIVLGDRSIYVITRSYLDLCREIDFEQNAAGLPQYIGANAPPRPRRHLTTSDIGQSGLRRRHEGAP